MKKLHTHTNTHTHTYTHTHIERERDRETKAERYRERKRKKRQTERDRGRQKQNDTTKHSEYSLLWEPLEVSLVNLKRVRASAFTYKLAANRTFTKKCGHT